MALFCGADPAALPFDNGGGGGARNGVLPPDPRVEMDKDCWLSGFLV
jgi:hypothetical protein